MCVFFISYWGNCFHHFLALEGIQQSLNECLDFLRFFWTKRNKKTLHQAAFNPPWHLQLFRGISWPGMVWAEVPPAEASPDPIKRIFPPHSHLWSGFTCANWTLFLKLTVFKWKLRGWVQSLWTCAKGKPVLVLWFIWIVVCWASLKNRTNAKLTGYVNVGGGFCWVLLFFLPPI